MLQSPDHQTTDGARPARDHFRIAILGAGFGGLGMAIRLKQDGIDDFVVLERDGDVGGTWWANTYPGCQCDIPSHLYSFSFAPNPDWSRTYPLQEELGRYARECAERYRVTDHIRLDSEVAGAEWDEDDCVWRIETSQGELSAEVLIAAPGFLSEPSIPNLPGLDRYEGKAFHTARWDHENDISGRSVAVVGTGASAIQAVPTIQPEVGRLKVFQRTPPWVMPHRDRPITDFERRLYRRVPAAQRLVRAGVYLSRELVVPGFIHQPRLMKALQRIAQRHMESQVEDPELRTRLTPNYLLGCKRILPSNEWYPALQKPNVELVTEQIREIAPNGIVTADGDTHEVDTIVFATGFKVTDVPLAHRIRAGGATMAEVWRGSPQAYLGTAVAGFPNFFFITGPNTGLGHNSLIFMIEAQINYLISALRTMRAGSATRVEVRRDAQEAYNERLQRRLVGTVWNTGGCSSWYIDVNGKNTTIWPYFTWRFWRETRRFTPGPYEITANGRATAGTTAAAPASPRRGSSPNLEALPPVYRAIAPTATA